MMATTGRETNRQTISVPVLTIAGSDCSGGAGIQADLKTFTAHGCYGASVITALTAQNTRGVEDVHPIPPSFIQKQIQMTVSDIDIKAIKTGMLFDTASVVAVANSLKSLYSGSHNSETHSTSYPASPPIVCDPVCVSTSGHTLLQSSALSALIHDLFPISTLVTPNQAEAELLLAHGGMPISIKTLPDMVSAAHRMLLAFPPGAVLLKGGHITVKMDDVQKLLELKERQVDVVKYGLLEDNMEILALGGQRNVKVDLDPELVVDVLAERSGQTTLFIRPRVHSTSTHGTGCTLSSAIACALAQGASLVDAIDSATIYTHLGIETAEPIGKGYGPLNHLHSISKMLLPKPTASSPYPFTRFLIKNIAQTWKDYVEHDFVRLLGKGILPRSAFVHFIKQDYLYLKYYARAYALLAAKSTSYTEIDTSVQTVLSIIAETNTHKYFCASFGITDAELEGTSETMATTAYGAHLIDMGLQGDPMRLLMALLACLLGYGEVGLWLKKGTEEGGWAVYNGNPYRQWIDDYSGERFQKALRLGLDLIEERALRDPPSPARLAEWKNVWERCTLLEKGFWDSAMAHAQEQYV